MSHETSSDDSAVRRVLPRGRNAVSREEVRFSQRVRLLEAMTAVTAEKGYASVTIADIVTRAGVAKPTFYEHFPDKETCFLAVYDTILGDGIAAMNEALDPKVPVEQRVPRGVHALIEFFAGDDARARIFLLESGSAGEAAIERESKAHQAYVDYYMALREEVREHQPEYPPISQTRAASIVGAIYEPLRAHLRAGKADQLRELEDEIVAAVRALALAH